MQNKNRAFRLENSIESIFFNLVVVREFVFSKKNQTSKYVIIIYLLSRSSTFIREIQSK
jgi:hypothetical protein